MKHGLLSENGPKTHILISIDGWPDSVNIRRWDFN